MMRQSRSWVNMRRATLIKDAISSSPHDSQDTASLNEDIERSSVLEDRTSPTPPSQVLTWIVYESASLNKSYGHLGASCSNIGRIRTKENIAIDTHLIGITKPLGAI